MPAASWRPRATSRCPRLLDASAIAVPAEVAKSGRQQPVGNWRGDVVNDIVARALGEGGAGGGSVIDVGAQRVDRAILLAGTRHSAFQAASSRCNVAVRLPQRTSHGIGVGSGYSGVVIG
jgi:hypothetical protein